MSFAKSQNLLISLIVLVLGFSVALYLSANKEQRESRITALKDQFKEVQNDKATRKIEYAELNEIYDMRKSDYKEAAQKLMSNHQFIAIFLVLGLMVLIYRPRDIRVPIVGIDIPEALVYIFILFGTIYLWSNFTLLLISTIDSRMVLEHLGHVIEHRMGGVNYYFSRSRTLLDQGFVDGWCTYYFNIFKGSPSFDHDQHRQSAAFLLFLVHAPLYGLTLAASLGASLRAIREKGTWLTLLGFVFNLSVLIGVTVIILDRIDYAQEFFAAVWSFAGISLLLWLKFGDKLVANVAMGHKTDVVSPVQAT